jgi:hypothetical protein
MKYFTGRDAAIAGIFCALGVIIPLLFHCSGLGSFFLPMFIPITLAGFFISVPAAATAGVITPLLSFLLTGMPPFFPPIAPIMCIELSVLGGSISFFYRILKWNIWISIITAIAIERSIFIIILLTVVPLFKLPAGLLTIGMVLWQIPGIILIIAIVPFGVKLINRTISL